MMIRILIASLTTAIILSSTTTAQPFEWANGFSGRSFEMVRAVGSDSAGNIFVAGYYNSTSADLDPGPDTAIFHAGNSNTSCFVVKMGADGTFGWARAIAGVDAPNGSHSILPKSILLDKAGNVYTIGYAGSGLIDYDPGPDSLLVTGNGDHDIFIHKMDANGNFLWVRNIGGERSDQPTSALIDRNGDLVIFGNFSDTVDFNPAPERIHYIKFTDQSQNGFVLKLDSAGKFKWVTRIGSDNSTFCTVHAGTGNGAGELFVAGTHTSAINFDPDSDSLKLPDPGIASGMFVLKLNAEGDFEWVKGTKVISFGPWKVIPAASSIAVNEEGSIYTAGSFNDCAFDLDPGPDTLIAGTQERAIFIQKFDAVGDLVDAWTMDSLGYESNRTQIMARPNGDIVIVGEVGGSLGTPFDIDPGPGVAVIRSRGESDIFITQLDRDGGFIAATSFGGRQDEQFWSAIYDPEGRIVVGGSFQGSVDFDPTIRTSFLNSEGNTDGYVLVWSDIPSSVNDRHDVVAPQTCDVTIEEHRGVFTVRALRSTANGRAIVCGVDGRVVRRIEFDSEQAALLSADNLPAGIYLLVVRTDECTIARKFVSVR